MCKSWSCMQMNDYKTSLSVPFILFDYFPFKYPSRCCFDRHFIKKIMYKVPAHTKKKLWLIGLFSPEQFLWTHNINSPCELFKVYPLYNCQVDGQHRYIDLDVHLFLPAIDQALSLYRWCDDTHQSTASSLIIDFSANSCYKHLLSHCL